MRWLPSGLLIAAVLACGLSLPGCTTQPLTNFDTASAAQRLAPLLPTDLLLLGEQHDAPEHQAIELAVVQTLASRNQLAAVAMEMAPAGASTLGLPSDATEAQVQATLQWHATAWPWQTYGPVVMAAVRAGVAVHGANVPPSQIRAAMQNTALDGALAGPALKAQQQRIRLGHCGVLPESQIQPMTRVQIARDQQMAHTLEALAAARANKGQTVLLIAGAGHTDKVLGVAQHLTGVFTSKVLSASVSRRFSATELGAEADALWITPELPPKDYCAAFNLETAVDR